MGRGRQRQSYLVQGRDDGVMGSEFPGVADWIEDLQRPADVTPGFLSDLRGYLDESAGEATADLDPDLLPLRLVKSRLTSLGRCERLAVAEAFRRPAVEPLSPQQFRGIALDMFVVHQLTAGRVLDPTAALRSMAAAEDNQEILEYIDAVEEDDGPSLAEVLDLLATAAADGWSDVSGDWLPRTQTRATAIFGGSVVCSGRIDVELGGTVSGRPGVVVEVKSGSPRPEHVAELYFYALLVALRDSVAPAAMLRWYPGGAPAVSPVSAAVLESVAVRVADAMLNWAALVRGSGPSERAGPWCKWCPDASVCPSFEADHDG